MKQMLKITLSVTAMLMLNCQKISAADLNLKPSKYSCLTREEKDDINDVFSHLRSCEVSLKTTTEADHDYWTDVELSILGGLVAGVLLDSQFHK